MISLKDRTPAFLLGKFQLTATVVFTALFALVIILFSIPYSNNIWFQLGAGSVFSLTVIFMAIAVAVAIISKSLMHGFSGRNMPFWAYLMWNLAEVMLICLIYALLTIRGGRDGLLDLHGKGFWIIYFNALRYGFISMAVPYILAGLYFDVIDKENTIRMISYGDVVTDSPVAPRDAEKIALFDNSGRLRLSLSVDSLYYFESDDNYIKVWYGDESGNIRQYMLRCKLRTVEERFSENGLLRCHRKYIVNMRKVHSIRKTPDGNYMIDLGLENIEGLPVSKTYEEMILSAYRR